MRPYDLYEVDQQDIIDELARYIGAPPADERNGESADVALVVWPDGRWELVTDQTIDIATIKDVERAYVGTAVVESGADAYEVFQDLLDSAEDDYLVSVDPSRQDD